MSRPYGSGENDGRGRRESVSSARTSSTSTTLTSLILEQNNTEAYDGAPCDTVPSSIVSFHHPHSFQSSHIAGMRSSGNGAELSSSELGGEDANARGRRRSELESLIVTSGNNSRSSSRNPRFRLFTQEQISNAEGASTLENAEYDLDWEATPEYEQNALNNSYRSRRSSFRSEFSAAPSVNSSNSYGSVARRRSSSTKIRSGVSKSKPSSMEPSEVYRSITQSSSGSSRYNDRDRIPIELESQTDELLDDRSSTHTIEGTPVDSLSAGENDSSSVNEDNRNQQKKQTLHAEYLHPSFHDKFYSNNLPHTNFQRFYVAEEDLVIVIAGYQTSKIGKLIHNILCIFTLGLFFLLMKWLPYYKVKLCGSQCQLAKAEWVVVETELGDFSIEPVNRVWYNRLMSTALPIIRETVSTTDGTSNRSFSYHHASDLNPNIPILISFEYRYINFIYNPVEDIFKTNNNWVDPNWLDLENLNKGLTKGTQEDRTLAFGKNQINLKVKSTFQILLDETLHPFYVFQIFSIILWSLDEYYYYAFCIFLISFISILNSLIETKKTSEKLAEMALFNCDVRVFRDEFWTHISSSELVPGDIYEISDPSLTYCPCDSILLTGDCIVNESMLTGESVPVSKLPATEETMLKLLNDMNDTQISSFVSKSFLYNGTKIMRTRIPNGQTAALAVVIRTGFSTIKGSLVRSMVFPKPVGFKFYEDSFKYIGFMTLIAFIGFSISCVQFIRIGLEKKTMILRALDIITIVVPPALPATLTIGTNFALSRLTKKGIFCIAPKRVDVAGKIDIMCFDKTGTLTEDELDVLGVHVVESKHGQKLQFSELKDNTYQIFTKFSLKDCSSVSDFKSRDFLISLLTCHSLRHVDGELLGDPLDFKMFQFTGWSFEEDFKNDSFHSLNEERHEENLFPENVGIIPAIVHPDSNNPKNKFTDNDPNNFLGIVRSFEFLAELRRMSVIVKPNGDNVFWAFVKGAPEVILDICNKSTLPSNYEELLHQYTHSGYRVIACAGKTLPKRTWLYSQRVTREEVESNLEFLGFIVFENKLKPASKPTLQTLQEASIRTVMCTGDNILTAISIGKQSGLVQTSKLFVPSIGQVSATGEESIIWSDTDNPDVILDVKTLKPTEPDMDYSLGVTGEIFRILFKNNTTFDEEYTNEVLLKACIYARMSPDEKHELMKQLQKLDYVVGFCGDGANDCGALKAADVGISLSEAEASVAAPFTSQKFDISCVLDVIKGGRASLVTSFACFQYMSLYSAIQFITITILYGRGSNLGDFQFLYIDLFLIVPIAIFMSWSNPYDKIAKKRPSANLVSPKILAPLVCSIAIALLFQAVPWLLAQKSAWYITPVVGGDDVVQSTDNTVLFFVSNFQYIIVAIVLSVGPPYREPMSKNTAFLADILLSILASIAIMLISPLSHLGKLLQLTHISTSFKLFICLWGLMNYFTQLHIPSKLKHLFKKKSSSKKYKNILRTQQKQYEA